jgi:hypothetical protein
LTERDGTDGSLDDSNTQGWRHLNSPRQPRIVSF